MKVAVAVTLDTSFTLVIVILVAVVLPDLISTLILFLASRSLEKLPPLVTLFPSTCIVPLFCSIVYLNDNVAVVDFLFVIVRVEL